MSKYTQTSWANLNINPTIKYNYRWGIQGNRMCRNSNMKGEEFYYQNKKYWCTASTGNKIYFDDKQQEYFPRYKCLFYIYDVKMATKRELQVLLKRAGHDVVNLTLSNGCQLHGDQDWLLELSDNKYYSIPANY